MTTQINSAIISGYSFSLEGLKISYTKDGEKFTLTLDSKASCQAFKECGFIEDFTIQDSTGEPVILFTDDQQPLGYGYQLWHDFIKSFPLNMSLLISVLESRQEKKEAELFY